MGSIDWKHIPKNGLVKVVTAVDPTDVKRTLSHFEYRGKLVTWTGHEAIQAQQTLNRMTRRPKKKKRRR